MTIRILTGDCRETLKTLPDASVQCCITSPPYWALRSYLPADHPDKSKELGSEETPDEYVAAMVGVFREVRRVLRDDGTLWLNIGDSYSHGGCGSRDAGRWAKQSRNDHMPVHTKKRTGTEPKNLLGIPWMLAFALRADGWILRSEVIWAKPNAMPESVTDRPSKSHETVFLLSKSARYFYDADAVRTPLSPKTRTTYGSKRKSKGTDELGKIASHNFSLTMPERAPRVEVPETGTEQELNMWADAEGANLRSVWSIAAQAYEGAHFATFPPELVEPCVKTGSSVHGCCALCGAPWKRKLKVTYVNPGNRTTNGPRSLERRHETPGFEVRRERVAETIGWVASCKCDAAIVSCTVLDPFGGTGPDPVLYSGVGGPIRDAPEGSSR